MKVIHRSGANVLMPQHVLVTREFSLLDNWSDFDAVVSLSPAKYTLHALFPADSLPNSAFFKTTAPPALYNKAQDIANAFYEQVQRNAIGELQGNHAVVEGAKAQRRKDTAAKARVARSKASAERRKMRKIEL